MIQGSFKLTKIFEWKSKSGWKVQMHARVKKRHQSFWTGRPNVNNMDSCCVISLIGINKNIMKVRNTCDGHDDMTQ